MEILIIVSIIVGIIGIWQRCKNPTGLFTPMIVIWAMRHPTPEREKQLKEVIDEKMKETGLDTNAFYAAIQNNPESIIRKKAVEMQEEMRKVGATKPNEPSAISAFWAMAKNLKLADVRKMIKEHDAIVKQTQSK